MTQTMTLASRRVRLAGVAGVATVVGGVAWLATGLASTGVDLGNPAVFYAVEAGWIASDVLLLAGLLGLGWSGATGGRLGVVGIGGAVLGRLVFVAAEVQSLVRGGDEDGLLLPAAAVLTAISMVMAGIAVLRTRHWVGWRRLVPLATGVYPFLFMFPFVVVSPNPSLVAIAGWGILWTLLGIALRPAAATRQLAAGAQQTDVA